MFHSFQNENLKSSVYLFVFDEDHLFAQKAKITYVFVSENEEHDIPCKPTHPDIQMKIFSKNNDITDHLEAYHFRYSPTEGLVVTKGHEKFHQNDITCEAQYKDKIQRYKFKMDFFRKVTLHQPAIAVTNKFPVSGESVVLSCIVTIFSLNSKVDLKWILPNETSRYKIGGTARFPNVKQRYTTIKKNFTLNPISETDQNLPFQCMAVNGQERSNPREFSYKLVRKHARHAHIDEVTFEGGRSLTLPASRYLGK